jgi:hypothetical protein
MGIGVCAIAALLASACGSSSSVQAAVTSPDGGPGGGSSGGAFGGQCSESQECASLVCLRFTSNAEGATGICSALCSTGAECGRGGACIPVPSLDGGACFPGCSGAAGCSGGLPCIWSPSLDAGVCQPFPATFCGDIAAQKDACEACLGSSCCSAITACAEDFACGQLESACSGKPACANTLQVSGNAKAQALGSCVTSSCAAACQ